MLLGLRDLLVAILNGIGILLAVLVTLFFAFAAGLCWGAVLDGTAAANGDGGLAIGYTFLAVFMGAMLWMSRGR